MAVLDNPDLRNTAVAAAGTTQTDATVITWETVLVPTITQGAGVVLKEQFCVTAKRGRIYNGAAAAGATSTGQSLLVYPWSGAAFNGQTVDQPLTLPAGTGMMWEYLTSTKIGILYA